MTNATHTTDAAPLPRLSREVPIDPAHAALLFIDVQNYSCRPDGGEYAELSVVDRDARYGFFLRTLRETALPNMQKLQAACRQARIEVMYTVIEALTKDGRDQSLDYKISRLFVPRGSWDALVAAAIAPAGDEIVLPKTSSSVFISTNIDYVLRNNRGYCRQVTTEALVAEITSPARAGEVEVR